MAAVSDDIELTGKMVDTVYKNILNKFNPAARQLVAASKTYLKTLHGVASASQTYLDALSKLSEIAVNSEMGAAKDIGESLADMVAAMLEIRNHETTLLKAFSVDVLSPLEDNLEKDHKVVQNEHKQFISRWRSLQERYQRAEADVKKRQRKMKNNKKNATLDKDMKQHRAYEHSRVEYESFLETSLRNVLVQERRRYGFVLERQCSLSQHYRSIYSTGGTILEEKLPHWTRVYDQREALPDDVRQHLHALHYSRKSTDLVKDITSPKACIIDNPVVDNGESSPLRSSMVRARSTGELSSTTMVNSPLSSNATEFAIKALYSFQADGAHQLTFVQGDLLLPVGEAKNGWQFGQNDRTNKYGWFPVAYTNNTQYDIARIEPTTLPANETTSGDQICFGTLSKARQDFVHDDTVSSCQPSDFGTVALTTFIPQTVTSHRTSMTSSASIMTLAPGYVNRGFKNPENTFKTLPPRFSVQQELTTRLQQRMSRHNTLIAPEGELSPLGPPTLPSVDGLLKPPTSPTSSPKELPVSTQKQLPVSIHEQLPTSAQKQLATPAQKQLATPAQKQLPMSTQKQLAISAQNQWPTAVIESKMGGMRRSKTTPVTINPNYRQNSLHSSNDSGFGADPAVRNSTDLQTKTQSKDPDRSWILFSRCSNNKDLLRPFLSEHNSDVTAKKSTDEVRAEGRTGDVSRLTDHFVTIDRRNSKQNKISASPRTLQQRVSRKCSLLKETLSMTAISNKLSIAAPSNLTGERKWLKGAPFMNINGRSSPRSLSVSDLLELDADDSFLLVQEHRALAAPTDTHQSHLSGDPTTNNRPADGSTSIIQQKLRRFSIDPFNYGSYLRRRLQEQDDFTTDLSHDVTKLAFDDVSASAAQYSPWCDLWTDRRLVAEPSANQNSPLP